MLAFALASHAQQKAKTQFLLVPMSDSVSQVISYDMDVMKVIDSKCLGCHSPKGKSDKARKALIWENLQTLSGADAYAKLDEMMEVIEEGSMPPKKMIEKYPGLKLTEEETAALKEWTESMLAKLEE